ncbi:protein srg1 [Quercus suber]|uniref:Protein srg1 n=1 Tax=Quercus suber TaxID=58331 RepID=A0AAW0KJA4_QUESU
MPVPSVQELAKETPSTVPPRYVRYDREPPIITDNTSLPQVPVIDMQRLFSLEFIDSELEKEEEVMAITRRCGGFGQAFVVFDEQKLDWGYMFNMITIPTHLRKPHLFPKIQFPYKSLSLSLSLKIF